MPRPKIMMSAHLSKQIKVIASTHLSIPRAAVLSNNSINANFKNAQKYIRIHILLSLHTPLNMHKVAVVIFKIPEIDTRAQKAEICARRKFLLYHNLF